MKLFIDFKEIPVREFPIGNGLQTPEGFIMWGTCGGCYIYPNLIITNITNQLLNMTNNLYNNLKKHKEGFSVCGMSEFREAVNDLPIERRIIADKFITFVDNCKPAERIIEKNINIGSHYVYQYKDMSVIQFKENNNERFKVVKNCNITSAIKLLTNHDLLTFNN